MIEHCAFCGGKLTYDSQKHTCTKCAKTFYDNPKAAVVVMLYTPDKKYLVLARRAHKPEVGKLDFIGGFLDVGESFEQAAYREMQEESGLSKDDLGELKYVTSIYNAYQWEGVEVPTTSVCFVAEIRNDKQLKAGDDVSSFEYVPVDSLPPHNQCAWLDMPRVLVDTAQFLVEM